MWGIVPAAGMGTRIQPLAFSKELLPVGSRLDGEVERPRAVSEYLIERMILAGVDKLCIVISSGKTDIVSYYGGAIGDVHVSYVVQSEPAGLCDAIFRAMPLLQPQDEVVVGLPDTVWFPRDGLSFLPLGQFSFLLFPVEQPELFDAVVIDANNRVQEIFVKGRNEQSSWIWGAFKLTGRIFKALHDLWLRRERHDLYVGHLVNAYIAEGGKVFGIRAGSAYVDVGTLHGYREAIGILSKNEEAQLSPEIHNTFDFIRRTNSGF
jgi:glucose-1-phosphate thymidylyltransferase